MTNEVNTNSATNTNNISDNNISKKTINSTPYFLWFVVLLLVAALGYVSYVGYEKEKEFNSIVNDLKQVNLELKKNADDADMSSKKIGLLADEQTSTDNKLKKLELQQNKLAKQTEDLYKIKQELIISKNELLLLESRQAIFLAKQILHNKSDLQQTISILENSKNQVDNFLQNNIDSSQNELVKQLQTALNNDLSKLKNLPVLDIQKISKQLNSIAEDSYKWNLFYTSHPTENLNTINNKNSKNSTPSITENNAKKNNTNLVENMQSTQNSNQNSPQNIQQNNNTANQSFFDKSIDYLYDVVENSWSDIRELIRIQKIEGDNKDDFLLSPQQEWFLRENIRLHLINAKLALLMYQGDVFNSELDLLQQKILRYFDNNNSQVKNSLQVLQELKNTPFIKLPNLESEQVLNN